MNGAIINNTTVDWDLMYIYVYILILTTLPRVRVVLAVWEYAALALGIIYGGHCGTFTRPFPDWENSIILR
jgi:hypothetical protein